VLAYTQERFRNDLSADDLVGENGFWVEGRAILALLDIDGPLLKRNSFD